MKNPSRFLIIFLAGAVLGSCDKSPGSGESATQVSDEKKVQPVKVITLALRDAAVQETVTSTVVPFEETYLSPALQGRIRSVKVEVNDRVQKGQLLAEMDPTQLEQTRLQLQNMQTDLARMDTLLKTGSVTQQSFDQLNSQVESTGLVVENLEENTYLRAPYPGIITGKYYNDGEMFSPTPNTPSGKAALISMIQVNPMKVMVNLGENYLPLVRQGMQATVLTDVYPDHPFTGTVFRIHPTVSPATRTFAIEVKVPNADDRLRPGMFARVSLRLGDKQALMVPAISVLQTSGTNERYIMLNENDTARKVVVKIEDRHDDLLEIASPAIKGGEQLIIAGQANLENGDPVKVVED